MKSHSITFARDYTNTTLPGWLNATTTETLLGCKHSNHIGEIALDSKDFYHLR